MLIIDKKADIQTLRSLGANERLIKQIFLFEGWMISFVGAMAGILMGTGICLLQEYFGFLKLGTGYLVDAYPVVVKLSDTLLVLLTVLAMGFLAAYYPVKYLRKKQS